jgi:hypothetical protein
MSKISNNELKTNTLDLMDSGESVYIYLKRHSTDNDGKICLSHECVTEAEINAEIDRVEKELGIFRAAAKAHFN